MNGGQEGAYGDYPVAIPSTAPHAAMTLTEDAKTTFTNLGLDRDDALLAAKSMGQTIIEESQSSDTPLESMVYEVWGLYDDGMPACEFSVPEGEDIVFSGQFRTGGDTPFVERRRTLSPDALKALVEEAASNPDVFT